MILASNGKLHAGNSVAQGRAKESAKERTGANKVII